MMRAESLLGTDHDIEVIVRDNITVEDVYEHLYYDRIFVLLGGQSWANIDDIPDEFLEELRWRYM